MSLQLIAASNANLLCPASYLIRKKSNKNKKKYSSQWLLHRESEGFSHKLLKEIESEDVNLYRRTLRMTPVQFQKLLEMRLQ